MLAKETQFFNKSNFPSKIKNKTSCFKNRLDNNKTNNN